MKKDELYPAGTVMVCGDCKTTQELILPASRVTHTCFGKRGVPLLPKAGTIPKR